MCTCTSQAITRYETLKTNVNKTKQNKYPHKRNITQLGFKSFVGALRWSSCECVQVQSTHEIQGTVKVKKKVMKTQLSDQPIRFSVASIHEQRCANPSDDVNKPKLQYRPRRSIGLSGRIAKPLLSSFVLTADDYWR